MVHHHAGSILLVVGLFFSHASFSVDSASLGDASGEGSYVNEWAVHIEGGADVARAVATDLGYKYIRQIGALNNYYLLVRENHPRRAKREATHHTRALSSDQRVRWVEQQVARSRVKRDLINKRDELRAYKSINFRDSDWEAQKWYLNSQSLDQGVVPVWDKNITGKGVVVSVIDDGLETNHTDIRCNYDKDASYDFNDDDDDPSPRYDFTNENKHGTRCAGEIAMCADNDKCGVGVAYNAKIGGIRMLDGRVTDSLEASALTHNIHHIDIFSSSWGPNDDGKTVEGPGTLATAAFLKGITEGRDGKGVLYVWASGNGGGHEDNCNCDGYTDSPYTISVSSASQHRKSPWYAERCASTIATTYSSGSMTDQKIISTDLHDGCTDSHTGTSASAPLAAGIFALVLEANPKVTWRDIQHLIVYTSTYKPLEDNDGWMTNGAGLMVNLRFGFGLLNAAGLVNMADPSTFQSVGERHECVVSSDAAASDLPSPLNSGDTVQLTMESSGCAGQPNEVRYLEHVLLVISINSTKRGNIRIDMVSPAGTEVSLLTTREGDTADCGFKDWSLMSVHTWAEDPAGSWIVTIQDTSESGNVGIVISVELRMFGTAEQPAHMAAHMAKLDSEDKLQDNSIAQMSDDGKLSNEQMVEALQQLKNYISASEFQLDMPASEKDPYSIPSKPDVYNSQQSLAYSDIPKRPDAFNIPAEPAVYTDDSYSPYQGRYSPYRGQKSYTGDVYSNHLADNYWRKYRKSDAYDNYYNRNFD